jgi:hypothetical protein
MDEDGIRRRRLEATQQRRLDEQVADMRYFYDDIPPEERVRLREWLKQLIALQNQFSNEQYEYDVTLQVSMGNDILDKDGMFIRWGDFQFVPHFILRAFEAWDKGESFTP